MQVPQKNNKNTVEENYSPTVGLYLEWPKFFKINLVKNQEDSETLPSPQCWQL